MKRFFLMSLGVMVVVGMAGGVDASPTEFGHGCGTSCGVKVKRISDVKNVRLPSGKEVKTAKFLQEQFLSGELKTTSQRQFFADCQKRELASVDVGSMPNQKDWIKLTGDESDYTTVAAGRGYYFDSLCK